MSACLSVFVHPPLCLSSAHVSVCLALGQIVFLQAGAASQSQAQQSVDPQTYQGQTAGELTYGKEKAQDMLALKRGSGNIDNQGGLAQPQDVTGDPTNVHGAAQSVDAATEPSNPDQVSKLYKQTGELFLPHCCSATPRSACRQLPQWICRFSRPEASTAVTESRA